jgi:hypothetical protein
MYTILFIPDVHHHRNCTFSYGGFSSYPETRFCGMIVPSLGMIDYAPTTIFEYKGTFP